MCTVYGVRTMLCMCVTSSNTHDTRNWVNIYLHATLMRQAPQVCTVYGVRTMLCMCVTNSNTHDTQNWVNIYLHATLMRQVCNVYGVKTMLCMYINDSLKTHTRSVLVHCVQEHMYCLTLTYAAAQMSCSRQSIQQFLSMLLPDYSHSQKTKLP